MKNKIKNMENKLFLKNKCYKSAHEFLSDESIHSCFLFIFFTLKKIYGSTYIKYSL